MAMLIVLSSAAAGPIYIQAHRGGLEEVPENTMAAFEHAWRVPGAIPEMDLRTTQDGVIVLLHDATPARTTDAPPPWDKTPLRAAPWAEVAKWDAGVKFSAKHAGARVPRLEEVFAVLKAHPERQVYLDLKDVDLEELRRRIVSERLERQVIFVHGDLAMCAKLKGLFPGARTMSWLSGPGERVKRAFDALSDTQIQSVSHLQFHLAVKSAGPPVVYEIEDDYLRAAAARMTALGVEMQLRPFAFDQESLARLVSLGATWFVADAPRALQQALAGGAP